MSCSPPVARFEVIKRITNANRPAPSMARGLVVMCTLCGFCNALRESGQDLAMPQSLYRVFLKWGIPKTHRFQMDSNGFNMFQYLNEPILDGYLGSQAISSHHEPPEITSPGLGPGDFTTMECSKNIRRPSFGIWQYPCFKACQARRSGLTRRS